MRFDLEIDKQGLLKRIDGDFAKDLRRDEIDHQS